MFIPKIKDRKVLEETSDLPLSTKNLYRTIFQAVYEFLFLVIQNKENY
jgi:hypothetical protein